MTLGPLLCNEGFSSRAGSRVYPLRFLLELAKSEGRYAPFDPLVPLLRSFSIAASSSQLFRDRGMSL